MALANSKIKIEHREILLNDRPRVLYEISPKATVPVLYIGNNNIIDESLDIMLWVIKTTSCDWLKNNSTKQLEMIEINDSHFKYFLDRYKYSDKYPELTFENYQNKCKKYLNEYDDIIKNNLYFSGNFIQLVDIALFPFIRQCAHVDTAWFEKTFLNLNNWLNNIKTSSLFLSVMHKYEIWDQKKQGIITIYK